MSQKSQSLRRELYDQAIARAKHTVIDGPFSESKELIAGYAILKLPSKAAAIEWAIRFGQIVKVNEVEVRQLPEW